MESFFLSTLDQCSVVVGIEVWCFFCGNVVVYIKCASCITFFLVSGVGPFPPFGGAFFVFLVVPFRSHYTDSLVDRFISSRVLLLLAIACIVVHDEY